MAKGHDVHKIQKKQPSLVSSLHLELIQPQKPNHAAVINSHTRNNNKSPFDRFESNKLSKRFAFLIFYYEQEEINRHRLWI